MSLWMMGGGWQAPFNRTFFNVARGEILDPTGKEDRKRAGRKVPSNGKPN